MQQSKDYMPIIHRPTPAGSPPSCYAEPSPDMIEREPESRNLCGTAGYFIFLSAMLLASELSSVAPPPNEAVAICVVHLSVFTSPLTNGEYFSCFSTARCCSTFIIDLYNVSRLGFINCLQKARLGPEDSPSPASVVGSMNLEPPYSNLTGAKSISSSNLRCETSLAKHTCSGYIYGKAPSTPLPHIPAGLSKLTRDPRRAGRRTAGSRRPAS